MPKKNVALLNVGKVLMGISATSLAAIGSASGNLLFAGLSAVPLGLLTTSDTWTSLIRDSIAEQEVVLELPRPAWWGTDISAWQGVCAEIEDHLPHILQHMTEYLQHFQGVVTMDMVRQQFSDAVVAEPLTWAPNADDRQRIAEEVATPLFQRIDEALEPLIGRLRQEQFLKDTHTAAMNTGEIKDMLGQILGELFNTRKPMDLQPARPPFDDVLLPLPEHFINRDEDRQWLLTRLSSTGKSPTTVLRGFPGIGKTSLAAWAVQTLRGQNRYRDGIAVVLCQGAKDSMEILRRVLARFDPQRRPPGESNDADLADKASQLLSGKETLVVLDNVEPDLAVERVITPLKRAGTTVLLTARHVFPHTAISGENQRTILHLSPNDAVHLFMDTMGRNEDAIKPPEKQAIDRIIAALARHTLAVRLAGAYAAEAHRDLAELARELEGPQRAIELPEGDTPRAVALAFAKSTDALPPEAHMLFVALSAFPTTEMSRNAAIALAQQLAIASPETSIDTLIRRALVDAFTDNQMPEESDRERLHIHPLLRAFAGEAFKQWPEGKRVLCLSSIAEYYATYALGKENVALAPDVATIGALLFWADEQGQDSLVMDLCLGMRQFWRDRWSPEALTYLPRAIAIAQAMVQATPDRENRWRVARLSFAYGQILQNLGKIDEADSLFEESLALFRTVGDRQGEGAVLFQLSLSAQTHGQMEQAEAYLAESGAIAREIGDPEHEAAVLAARGQFSSLRGQFGDAEQFSSQALEIFRSLGKREQEIPVLMHLGQLAFLKGQLQQAEALYLQARAAFREIGHRGGEGTALSLLGIAALSDGRPENAEQYLQESFGLTREVGDRRGEAVTLIGLGLIAFT